MKNWRYFVFFFGTLVTLTDLKASDVSKETEQKFIQSINKFKAVDSTGLPPTKVCDPANQALAGNKATADSELYNKVCGDPRSEAPGILSPVPAAFASISADSLKSQDNNPGSYENYSDFQTQLDRFLKTDEVVTDPRKANWSRQTACKWLFWNNGVMRRPYAGTLCAIGKYSDFIKEMATSHGVPPEFIACALGGDSMIYINTPDYIAQTNSSAKHSAQSNFLNLVKKSAFEDKHLGYNFQSPDLAKQLIEKIAVIGAEGKEKYMKAFGPKGNPNLEFGKGPAHEAEILSSIFNLGADNLNPSGNSEPTLNYFGLSCARMMKIYQLHLKSDNPSKDACD